MSETSPVRWGTAGPSLVACGILVLFWACATGRPVALMPGEDFENGAKLYQQHCGPCHGDVGRGNGPAAPFLSIWPRNFREERFHFVSTADGMAPAHEDLVRFIRRGSRDTAMPAHPHFADSQLNDLASYVREIRRLGIVSEVTKTLVAEEEDFTPEEVEEIATDRITPSSVLPVPPRPPGYLADAVTGASLFAAQCASCHGSLGRGDGSEELADDLGRPIRARDLTKGEYRGGGRDQDLFWRIRCGIPGTPMPGAGPNVLSDEDVWQIVDYLRILAGGRGVGRHEERNP